MKTRKVRAIAFLITGTVLLTGAAYGGYRAFRVQSQRFAREAEAKLSVGDQDGAITALQHHVLSHPSDIDARLRLGELLRKAGSNDSAARVYEQLMTDIQARKKVTKKGAKPWSDPEDLLRKASYADIGFAFARKEQANARFAAAEWDEAATYFKDEAGIYRGVTGLKGMEAQARYNAATAYFNARRYDSAKTELDSVATLFPEWDSTRVVELREKVDDLQRRGVMKPVSLEEYNRLYK